MPETKTKLTFRCHDWFNSKTHEVKYGIKVKPVGLEVRYAHCAEANKPLLFDTEKERDAKLKELRQEQRREHPPQKRRKVVHACAVCGSRFDRKLECWAHMETCPEIERLRKEKQNNEILPEARRD